MFSVSFPSKLIQIVPWNALLSGGWQVLAQWRQRPQGMYEVLEYESLLDLKDEHGRFAQFSKREKVKYLQNNIIAYQDHAWGDGEILQDYQCTPGKVVDQYRPGQKTFLLISLRQVKKRGDVDIFHINWDIKDGFIREHELWETEVRQRTEHMKIQVVFPKTRPPHRMWIEEALNKARFDIQGGQLLQLPNGRFQLTHAKSY